MDDATTNLTGIRLDVMRIDNIVRNRIYLCSGSIKLNHYRCMTFDIIPLLELILMKTLSDAPRFLPP